MSTVHESSKIARPSRGYLAALVFLWGVFAFFTVCRFLRQDDAPADSAKMQDLKGQVPAKRLAHNWPQWRGPNRDGFSTETGLLTSWLEGGPRKLWEQPAGEGFSSLAVARGRVFSMLQDGEHEAVVCWDADTGKEIWRHRYPAHFRHEFGNGPRSTPAVDGDLVYALGATGILTCLKAFGAQSQLVWEKDLLKDFGANNLKWGISCSPLVDGDLVFANPGGPDGRSLVALDKFTGALRWQTQGDVGANGSPVLADIAGQRQVIFFTAKGLVAVTPAKGELLWRFPWTTDYDANTTTPIPLGDFVFISSGYGKGCGMVKIDRTAQSLEPTLVYANRKMMNHFSTCVRFGEHLYGFNDTTLTCMEIRTGKVAWKERGFDKGTLTIADGHLFILGEYGTLAVAEATPDAYRETGRCQFSDKRCWTVPVIANGRLYVRNEQRLACFDLRK